jgi:nitrile hydratase
MGMRKPEEPEIQAAALESLLHEKGTISRDVTDEIIHRQQSVTHRRGTEVVARAWTDHHFRRRLLGNARLAIAEMGFTAE